jgi:hypothetical protein
MALRALIGLPKNTHQQRELITSTLVQQLLKKGFQEQTYVKPFRVFKLGFHTVKFSVAKGIAFVNIQQFSGLEYYNCLEAVNDLSYANNN